MRIVILNTKTNGSTGKISSNILNYFCQKGFETIFISGYKTGKETQNNSFVISNKIGLKVCGFFERLTGLTGMLSLFQTIKAKKIIKRFKPDIVILGNMHGSYINIYALYGFLAKRKIAILQLMWDEYPLTGKCVYTFECEKYKNACGKCPNKKEYPSSWFFDNSRMLQLKKERAYLYNRICFVGPDDTVKKAKESALLRNKLVYSLPDAIDTGFYRPRDVSKLRKELNIQEDSIVLLSVCYYTNTRKGGPFFLELARMCSNRNDLVFIHVGYNGPIVDFPKNFIPIPPEDNQDRMAEFYSIADLFICTSMADTMPNTCLESLSCGTRICGFDISGIPSCACFPYGRYVEPGNLNQLKEIVESQEKKKIDSIRATREYAIKRYSNASYCEYLYKIAQQMINNNCNGN